MEKGRKITVVAQFLYLLTDERSLLERTIMMEVLDMTAAVMYVFITIPLQAPLHGHSSEMTLMGKRQVIEVVCQFLYLLTDQG